MNKCIHIAVLPVLLLSVFTLAPFIALSASASDYWVAATDATVVTNNDCGYISAINGKPTILRSFQRSESEGTPAMVTDRVNSGDEIRVPAGARLEVTSPANVIVVFGEGCRVRFSGKRIFVNEFGQETVRLDLELLAGEFRIQVRRNETRPEVALVSTEEADYVVTGGDVCFGSGGAWHGTVLSGGAAARLRRGRTLGAPFSLEAGRALSMEGRSAVSDDVRERLVAKLPFSFESIRAALPPQPSMGYELEAP